jgi:predicted nucleotidyltransferase
MSENAGEIQIDTRLRVRRVSQEILDYMVQKIVREIHPVQIILFGSRARGEATEASDVDLLVIQDTAETNREVRRRIEQLLWGRLFGVDLIVRTPAEVSQNLADRDPFYTLHIFSQGRILYERPSEPAG